MVNETDIISTVWDQTQPFLLERLAPLITIFKAVGVVILIYFIYLIFVGILKIRDRKRLKENNQIIKEMNHKLDILLTRTKPKKVKIKKSEKKTKK